MGLYYLDIETDGLDHENNKIITIQYQQIDEKTLLPLGNLTILKEKDYSSEEEIVKLFFKKFMGVNNNLWDFIPIMQNSLFEFKFLLTKFRKYCGFDKDPITFLSNKPHLDIKTSLILANGLSFKNSGLNKFSAIKTSDGKSVLEYYKVGEWEKIDKYIQDEAKAFFQILKKICYLIEGLKEDN